MKKLKELKTIDNGLKSLDDSAFDESLICDETGCFITPKSEEKTKNVKKKGDQNLSRENSENPQ